jgi:NAD/NADP transhydrogenase alpha subunit
MREFVEKFGVTIIGSTDLASRMGRQSSELYGATVVNLLTDVIRHYKLGMEVRQLVNLVSNALIVEKKDPPA